MTLRYPCSLFLKGLIGLQFKCALLITTNRASRKKNVDKLSELRWQLFNFRYRGELEFTKRSKVLYPYHFALNISHPIDKLVKKFILQLLSTELTFYIGFL